MSLGSNIFYKGKLGIVYAAYADRDKAEFILEDLFAVGEILESEYLGTLYLNGRHCIILTAE